ncbi:MAG: hypothetical protein ACLSUZ_04785 [Bifidobacterium pseudocatenulatum]
MATARAWSRAMQTFHRGTPFGTDSSAINAAACRDIKANEIAFGPSICGELYNVTRIGTAVQDYQGAQTDFLVLAPRKEAGKLLEQPRSQADMEYESVLTLIPLVTGPGVLANLLDVFRDAGLNMTSFISRPIKGRTGTSVLSRRSMRRHGSNASMARWSKSPNTVTGPNSGRIPTKRTPQSSSHLMDAAAGGVRLDEQHLPDDWQNSETVGKELMW